MFPMFRNTRMLAAAKCAGGAFIVVSIAAGAAAADELTVKNNADVPIKVVVKNGGGAIGQADRIEKKSSRKVPLSSGVSLAKITPTVEALPLGVHTQCSTKKSGFEYEVNCDPVAAGATAAPAAPAGGGATTTSRSIEVENDLKDTVTVVFAGGTKWSEDHDIGPGKSATFTKLVNDDKNAVTLTGVVSRHVDSRISPCVNRIFTIPSSQAKIFVTPVTDSSTKPAPGEAQPCTLSSASRIERVAAGAPAAPAPPAGAGATAAAAPKLVIENDLKDRVTILFYDGAETVEINPRTSATFTKLKPPENGKTESVFHVTISRHADLSVIPCAPYQTYTVPQVQQVNFYVTRIAGSTLRPPEGAPTAGRDSSRGGPQQPPPSSCALTQSQNFEK